MTWVKLDDGFHSHPKILGLSLAAKGLYAIALSYCGDNLTDGHVPTGFARMQSEGDERPIDELLTAGLWEPDDSGYQVHDFLDYNPPRSEQERARRALSRKRALAGRKGAESRWGRNGKSHGKPDSARNLPSPPAAPVQEEMAKGMAKNGPVPEPVPEEKNVVGSLSAVGESFIPTGRAERARETRAAPSDQTVEKTFSPATHRLCDALADLIAADGTKRPRVGERWLTEMDRLLRLDHATVEQVEYAVNWMHRYADDSWWAANVLSPHALRRQWPRLTKQIRRQQAPAPRTAREQRNAERRALFLKEDPDAAA